MITFKQFITEESSFDLEKFKKDCAPFLSHLKGQDGKAVLYHGTTNYPRGTWDVRSFKERTKPRDSSKDLHKALNEFFKDKFGIEPRNWLFSTGFPNEARVYSRSNDGVLAIFPIGEFEWICGLDDDLRDLTGWHSRLRSDIMVADVKNKISWDQRHKMATDFMMKKMGLMNWKHNTDLVECIKSDNEVMLKCSKFYAFQYLEEPFTNVVKPFLETL